MPRPKDLVKALLIPVTYVLGILSVGEVTTQSLVRAVVVVAAVELLIYPARYQWNDVRGFVADQRHPDSVGRGRLPGPIERARRRVLASTLVAVVRLLLVGVLVVALPDLHLGGVLAFAVFGVFGVAVVYEWLRSAFTGRDGQIPPPLRTGVVLIWLTVGAGYAVRGMIGLALAIDPFARPALTVWAAVTLWAYGVAFVTSRWAVEATAFATAERGDVTFAARADQAREHLLVLVRWLPDRLSDPSRSVRHWAPLWQRTPLVAPWNIAVGLAGVAAAMTGRLLCGPSSAGQLVTTGIAGAAATVAVVTMRRARPLVVAAGASGLSGIYALTDASRPLLGVAPWLLISAAYLYFSSRSLYDLGRPGPIARPLGTIRNTLAKFIFGAPTWAAICGRYTATGADDAPPSTDLAGVARSAAAAGALVAMHWWADLASLQIEEKRGPRDLVSRADREAEVAIREELARLRPTDGVLGEEGGTAEGSSGVRWVIDPIDGTTSYLYGRADWAVSVAAVRSSDDVVIAAAVIEPVLGRITSAQRGRGTFCNGKRVTVSDAGSLVRALVEINFGRDDQREVAGMMVHELAVRARDLRRGGSAASALAHVATGQADAVWAPGLQPWDCAAGVLLVEEAGGLVGDLNGPTDGVWPGSGDVLAANPALWAALREILAPVYTVNV
ncbi:inositol monophosphatase family protein [Mycolicibacterium vaccae]|uniref:inositol monophosphatase family protein n=1 Tax=Mycolicibacterium vaccae TaxID=1810 RepID=UPI003CEEC145